MIEYAGSRCYDDSADEKEKMLVDYLPLIKKIAGKLSIALPPSMDENDLIGSGIIGLLEARERFDASREVEFATFATWRIKGAMLDELRKLSWAPRSFFQQLRVVQEKEEVLSQHLQREPSTREIAEALGWQVSAVEQVWVHYNLLAVQSMEKLLYAGDNDEGLRLGELVMSHENGPVDLLEQKEQLDALKDALDGLDERDRILLSLYYYEDLSQKEIAELMKVSAVRVSQLHARALVRLRKTLQEDGCNG